MMIMIHRCGAGYLSHGQRVSLPPAPLEAGACMGIPPASFRAPSAARMAPNGRGAPFTHSEYGYAVTCHRLRGRRVAFTCFSNFLLSPALFVLSPGHIA